MQRRPAGHRAVVVTLWILACLWLIAGLIQLVDFAVVAFGLSALAWEAAGEWIYEDLSAVFKAQCVCAAAGIVVLAVLFALVGRRTSREPEPGAPPAEPAGVVTARDLWLGLLGSAVAVAGVAAAVWSWTIHPWWVLTKGGAVAAAAFVILTCVFAVSLGIFSAWKLVQHVRAVQGPR
jgi:hypothetical protein